MRESERKAQEGSRPRWSRGGGFRGGGDDIVADDSWEKMFEEAATPPAFLLPADTMSRRISFLVPTLPSPSLGTTRAFLPAGIINLTHPPSPEL